MVDLVLLDRITTELPETAVLGSFSSCTLYATQRHYRGAVNTKKDCDDDDDGSDDDGVQRPASYRFR